MDSCAFSFEGDRDTAAAALKEAWGRARAVRSMKESLGISQLVRSFDLAGGEQVYVVDLEHTRAVHIVAPTVGAAPAVAVALDDLRFVGTGVPDYCCGAVTEPVIETAEIPAADGGEPTRIDRVRGLRLTELGATRVPQETASRKLAVPEHGSFAQIGAPPGVRYTQHRGVRPGNYTGAMRRVVQLLLGIGDQQQETWERRWAGERGATIGQWLTRDEPDPAQSVESAFGVYRAGEPPVRVQVLYDYRSHRTHGIGWGEDGRAYVVEIGSRGVLVWPLALDPVSRTAAGAARYRELYPELFADTAAAPALFPLLGGFPTGAPPPQTPDELAAKLRAGEIVRALDAPGMAAYSGTSPFSTALGWAFHPDARAEAHNTCYGYRDDGVRIGYHFAVGWTIGAYAEPTAAVRAGELIAALGLTDWEARKARRLTDAQCEDLLALAADAEALRKAFDAQWVAAPFAATATLREQRRGTLWHPGKLNPGAEHCEWFSPQPQIKFFEPMVGYLVSFDFGTERPPAAPPDCDAPLFVCWSAAGVLSVLNYWWREQPAAAGEAAHTREPCQFSGTWTDSVPNEGPRVYGNFYATDWDPRQELTNGGETTATKGTFRGTTDFAKFFAIFGSCCSIVREYWFSYEVERVRIGGHSLSVAAAIPQGDRSIYYLAELETRTGVTRSKSAQQPSIAGTGSTIRYGIIYDSVFHWVGVGCHWDDGPLSCTLREVFPPDEVESCFEGGPDFPIYSTCRGAGADRPGSEIWYSKRFGAEPQGPDWSVATAEQTEIRYSVRLFGDCPNAGEEVASQTLSGIDPDTGQPVDFYSTTMSPWWFLPSPTACDAQAYLSVNVNRWGSDLIGFQPQFDADPQWRGEPAQMRVGLASCYVGWIE